MSVNIKIIRPGVNREPTDFLNSLEKLGCEFLLAAGLVKLGEIQRDKISPVN